MDEGRRLAGEILRMIEREEKGILSTIVRVNGSAYRREGAKLLVKENGTYLGFISGGCLEQDIAENALLLLRKGGVSLRNYDLSEDVTWGLGIGCGGSIDLLMEPIPEEERTSITKKWFDAVREGRRAVLATLLPPQPQEKLLLCHDGRREGGFTDQNLEREILQAMERKLQALYPKAERLERWSEGEKVSIFIDVAVPQPELILFGAGHDAIPVARFAAEAGFRVKVVDRREAYLSEERFPSAERVAAGEEEWGERVEILPHAFVVIMNHHLQRDRVALHFALDSPASYIGVLGPRSRFEKLIKDYPDGERLREAMEGRVFHPVGLDLGGETAEEVALSIVSELVAIKRGHRGGHLAAKSGSIHDPAAEKSF